MRNITKTIALVLATVLTITIIPANATTTRAATKLNNPKVTGSSAKKTVKATYDCITFGNYWQKDTNKDGVADKEDKKTPIKWRVLSTDGKKALIVADQVLDCMPFNSEYKNTTWEDCTLRTWLNGEFMDNAFSKNEKSAIKTTKLVNKDSLEFGTKGGNDTEDKIFILSLEDIQNKKYGFTNYRYIKGADIVGKITGTGIYDFAKLRKHTEFSKSKSNSSGKSYCSRIDTCYWWLRAPGFQQYNQISERFFGSACSQSVHDGKIGVVPALYIDLSSTKWKAAGTVTLKAGTYKKIDDAIIYSKK